MQAEFGVKDIEYFVFYDKPLLKFERLLETYLALTPRGFRSFAKALPVWAHEKLFQDRILRDELSRYMPGVDFEKRLLYTEHHQSHAASAFYPSPYELCGNTHHGWRRRMDDDFDRFWRGK